MTGVQTCALPILYSPNRSLGPNTTIEIPVAGPSPTRTVSIYSPEGRAHIQELRNQGVPWSVIERGFQNAQPLGLTGPPRRAGQSEIDRRVRETVNNLLENSPRPKPFASKARQIPRLGLTGPPRRGAGMMGRPGEPMPMISPREQQFLDFLRQPLSPSPSRPLPPPMEISPLRTRRSGPATFSGLQTVRELQARINVALGRRHRALLGSRQSQEALNELRTLWREVVRRNLQGKIKFPEGYKK